MSYGYYRSGRGRGANRQGSWPGNGPFRHLPPWERPGWIYGPGSCWALGIRNVSTTNVPWISSTNNVETLKSQKQIFENQLNVLKRSLEEIEKRIQELENKQE